MASPKPNIVFICPDQVRRTALSPYGNELVRSPNIQRMADEGVTFTNFFANSAICGPSRFAIYTGHMPMGQGNWCNPNCVALPYLKYLGHYFGMGGYFTGSIGKLHGMPEDFDFGFGYCRFDYFDTCFAPHSYGQWLDERLKGRKDENNIRERIRTANLSIDLDVEEQYFMPGELSKEAWTIYEMEKFLSLCPGEKPFFLNLTFDHPHGAWEIIPAEDERYNHEEMTLPPNFEFSENDKPIIRGCSYEQYMGELWSTGLDENQWKKWTAKYYTSLTQVDKTIGKVFNLLGKYGYLDNTIVIFATDHGEMLGAFRREGKSYFYEDAVHIPFLVWGKGIPRGQQRDQLGEQIDIIPTLLDLAGLEKPDELEGVSLKPVLEKSESTGKQFVHAWLEWKGRIHQMAATKRYKLYRFRGFPNGLTQHLGQAVELYDLAKDPYELTNIFGQVRNAEITELKKEFCDYFWSRAGMIGCSFDLREKIMSDDISAICIPPGEGPKSAANRPL